MGLLSWFYSVKKHNVNVVDTLWSLMFLAAALFYIINATEINGRSLIIIALVAAWSLRLAFHLMVRNWDHEEDHRYQQIRQNNEPNFKFKSLYIIFGLQGLLAWIISIPLLFALNLETAFHWLDLIALSLWITGFIFEAVADYQLYKFKSQPGNKGRVLNSGLWSYTRHPNYFGEFCIWWAFYLFAIPSGGWWTIYAPALITFLLLKVSGVVMMEKDIKKRRPEYQSYIDSTNTFFPGLPAQSSNMTLKEE
jgi:steroid 5-alpha reductase family enzyme